MKLSRRTTEYLIYSLFWGALILVPFWSMNNGIAVETIDWDKALKYWTYLLPALVLFFINNNVLMPFLLYKRRRAALFVVSYMPDSVVLLRFYLCYVYGEERATPACGRDAARLRYATTATNRAAQETTSTRSVRQVTKDATYCARFFH